MSNVQANLVAMLPRLQRFARTLSGSSVIGDDLVQATCVRALSHEGGWVEGTRFDAWIFRILRNQWIDWLRRHRTEGDQEPIEDAPELVGEDGERRAHQTLMLKEVWRTIDRLPAEQREVLLLVCVEELSYREAAEVLGVPTGTVMSRLARARARLTGFEETTGSAVEELG
jgi:RNA polymerase sigma-70 factor, ECF subfamily